MGSTANIDTMFRSPGRQPQYASSDTSPNALTLAILASTERERGSLASRNFSSSNDYSQDRQLINHTVPKKFNASLAMIILV
jgi:hypothetical protein